MKGKRVRLMLMLLVAVAMGARAETIDLATVTANREAKDGDVLTGTLGEGTAVKISIADGATVTLSSVTIEGYNHSSYEWAGINCEGDATLVLVGTNSVKGFHEYHPGIHIPAGKTLTIRGDGSLTATSNGRGAGIGGGHYLDCGNIVIEGGTIIATGGDNAAAIGGGDGAACGDITITNGVTAVTVTKAETAANSIGAGYTPGTCGTVTIGGTVVAGGITASPYTYLTLGDSSDNGTTLTTYDDQTADVSLSGRTLYRDGGWNTICLPFDTAIEGSPLDGATVKTLSSTAYDSTTGTLTLNFSEATTIKAGRPYIIKWDSGTNLDSPLFRNVTLTGATANVTTTYTEFVGTYSPTGISGEDKTMLYLGADDKLYYPNAAMTINAFRAYFRLNGITADDPAAAVRNFVLNFGDGDGEQTSIHQAPYTSRNDAGAWYTLDGRRLVGKPTRHGIYINKGKQTVIK